MECRRRNEVSDRKRVGFYACGNDVIGRAFAVMDSNVKLVTLERAFADIGASLVSDSGDGKMFAINFALLDDERAQGCSILPVSVSPDCCRATTVWLV